MDNPDSPNSISSDQLTVDLLSPRTANKRRRPQNDIVVDDRRDLVHTPDVNNKNNNNDVGFVLMDDEHQENGDDETDVCTFFENYNNNILE